MSEATTTGRFFIDLPDSDAATALSGTGQSTLHRLESLTGATFANQIINSKTGNPSKAVIQKKFA